jgi:hypothetical protein
MKVSEQTRRRLEMQGFVSLSDEALAALVPVTTDFCLPPFLYGLLFGKPVACELGKSQLLSKTEGGQYDEAKYSDCWYRAQRRTGLSPLITRLTSAGSTAFRSLTGRSEGKAAAPLSPDHPRYATRLST